MFTCIGMYIVYGLWKFLFCSWYSSDGWNWIGSKFLLHTVSEYTINVRYRSVDCPAFSPNIILSTYKWNELNRSRNGSVQDTQRSLNVLYIYI